MQLNFLFENETQNNFFIIVMYVVVVFDREKEYVVSFELYLCCLILLHHISRDRLYFPTHVWQTKIAHLCKTGQSTHPKKNTLTGFCFCGIPHLFPRKITEGDI